MKIKAILSGILLTCSLSVQASMSCSCTSGNMTVTATSGGWVMSCSGGGTVVCIIK